MDRKVIVFAGLGVMLAACAKNVPHDLHTGEDGRQKGARVVKLERDEGRAGGIVTYPGGDRIDWKVIEVPKDATGTLQLKLKWTPPRPGLDLSFEAYDEYGNVVAAAKPARPSRRGRKTTKTAIVENARGKIYVQIYASARGDAGKYALLATLQRQEVEGPIDWLAIPVAEPPRLPAVPENVKRCDRLNFDPKLEACLVECPVIYDPKWPGCKDVCPDLANPDPEHKACQRDAACPAKPDKRFAKCTFEKCDPRNIDPANPNCEGVKPYVPDVLGLVTDVQATDTGARVTINLGTADGIGDGWRGVLLDRNDAPIRGTEFVVRAPRKNSLTAPIKLDASKIPADAQVRLSSP